MDTESLYSLELVVDKLYIPHTICRFPSVAFRLLDFPTILIEHVEEDLASKIKYKISRDPYYDIPEQFQDLKDKHGNFLIKKGKSCLFKISTKSLRSHLMNTPLYMMILDSFEKVPKLLGNSTIPLDEIMDNIVEDIKNMGNTVPSVHGDKGLFKIFSLMGKEIGYIVMGFRLLSLGPGLIPHIPDSAIAKRASEHQVITVKPTETHVFPEHVPVTPRKIEQKLIDTQEMGSMTEPEKHDVLMQTVDMCDKQIHVAISGPDVEMKKETRKEAISKTMSTQTDKKRRLKSKLQTENALDVEVDSDDDGFFISNIIQPPPLFYNSENEPKVRIEHAFNYDDDQSSVYTDDMYVEDLSDDDDKFRKSPRTIQQIQDEIKQKQNRKSVPSQPIPTAFPQQTLPAANNAVDGPLFPMLTALLNELSNLQNPLLIQQTMQQVAQMRAMQTKVQHQVAKDTKSVRPSELKPVKTFIQQTPAKVPTRDVKGKSEISKKTELANEDTANRSKHQKVKPTAVQPSTESQPKGKGWIRKAPEMGVKKSKLSYGLTNTQRLRLAKVNPEWLKNMEKEEMEAKSAKSKPVKLKEEEEFPTGEVSDTLTEVRRLALKNLNATDEDTLKDLELSMSKSKHSMSGRHRRHSPLRKRSKSPKHKKSESKKASSSQGFKGQNSPQADDEESDEDVPSVPSQRSIEVRIPSAQMYNEESDVTMNESEPENRRKPASRFPGFVDRNSTLPESIDGNVNKSLSDEYDNDSPLESTRNERITGKALGEKLTHSTIDYDTGTHQFQSTEEPELQKLIDSVDRSEVSDVMSSGRTEKSKSPLPVSNSQLISARFPVLNPKASMNSPIPALRKSQVMKVNGGQTSPGSGNSPAGTPQLSRSPSPGKSPVVTPRLSRSPSPTPKLPIPLTRKSSKERRFEFKMESIHTESVSSYVPSDDNEEGYSDDFQDEIISPLSTPDRKRKMIPSTKLGYTIH